MREERFDPSRADGHWQRVWDERDVFAADDASDRPRSYVLEMFPYPSGRIHIGHVRNYTMGDVLARYKRMTGHEVLHPMGWDAFGMPAENAAIEKGVHPGAWTRGNIANMKAQLKRLGMAFDWSRELATCDPDYYGHEQAMFIDFYEAGLVYRKESAVNWDPVDQTVLANEQVIDGKGWRSGAPVEKRKLSQWFLKITDFAQELLDGLGELDKWPEKVRHHAGELDRQEHRAAVHLRPVERRERRGLHHAARHDLRRQLRCRRARPPGRASRRDGQLRRRQVHRAMQEGRHHRGRTRDGRKARLRHRDRGEAPVHRRVPAGLHRQLRADGIWHRGDHGGARPRPARFRFRQQVRAADRPGGGVRCRGRRCAADRGRSRRRGARQFRFPRTAWMSPAPSRR